MSSFLPSPLVFLPHKHPNIPLFPIHPIHHQLSMTKTTTTSSSKKGSHTQQQQQQKSQNQQQIPSYLQFTKEGYLRLSLHIKPNASTDEIKDSQNILISAQPKNNEANAELVSLVASQLHVPKSDVKVVGGLKSREKVVVVERNDVDLAKVKEVFGRD